MPVRRARRDSITRALDCPPTPNYTPSLTRVHILRSSESPTSIGSLFRLREVSELVMSCAFDVSVQRHPTFRWVAADAAKLFFPKTDFGESAFDLEQSLSFARTTLLRTSASTEDSAQSLAFANIVSALHWVDGTQPTRAALHPANYVSAASALLRLLGSNPKGERNFVFLACGSTPWRAPSTRFLSTSHAPAQPRPTVLDKPAMLFLSATVASSSGVDWMDDVAQLTNSRLLAAPPVLVRDDNRLTFEHVQSLSQVLHLLISLACAARALKARPSDKAEAAAALLQYKPVLTSLSRLRDLIFSWRADEPDAVKWEPYFASYTASFIINIKESRAPVITRAFEQVLNIERLACNLPSRAISPPDEMYLHAGSVAGRAISLDFKELLCCLSLSRLYTADSRVWDIPLSVVHTLTRLIRMTCSIFYLEGRKNFAASFKGSQDSDGLPAIIADIVARETLLRSTAIPAALARTILFATFSASSNPIIACMVVSGSALSAGNGLRATFVRPPFRAEDAMTSSRVGLLAHIPLRQADAVTTFVADFARVCIMRANCFLSRDTYFEKCGLYSHLIQTLPVLLLYRVTRAVNLAPMLATRFATLLYLYSCNPPTDGRADFERKLQANPVGFPLSQAVPKLFRFIDVATADKAALVAEAKKISKMKPRFDLILVLPTSASIEDYRCFISRAYSKCDQATMHSTSVLSALATTLGGATDVVMNLVVALQEQPNRTRPSKPLPGPVLKFDDMDD